MRSIAGDATGCQKSLVDHILPMTRRNVNSATLGNVFESGDVAPWAKPRDRFVCMMTSFETNVLADAAPYVFVREKMWAERALTRGNGSSDDEATKRRCSIRTEVKAFRKKDPVSPKAFPSQQHQHTSNLSLFPSARLG